MRSYSKYIQKRCVSFIFLPNKAISYWSHLWKNSQGNCVLTKYIFFIFFKKLFCIILCTYLVIRYLPYYYLEFQEFFFPSMLQKCALVKIIITYQVLDFYRRERPCQNSKMNSQLFTKMYSVSRCVFRLSLLIIIWIL